MRKTQSQFSSMPQSPNPKRLTRRELAEELGRSLSAIARWQRARKIPFVRIGRFVRFNLTNVERALERYELKEVGHPTFKPGRLTQRVRPREARRHSHPESDGSNGPHGSKQPKGSAQACGNYNLTER